MGKMKDRAIDELNKTKYGNVDPVELFHVLRAEKKKGNAGFDDRTFEDGYAAGQLDMSIKFGYHVRDLLKFMLNDCGGIK